MFGPTGRPKGVREQDVYICDYRLDKSAHLFYKIHRNRYPVCTRPYAFDHFPKRLTPRRDFSVSAGLPSPLRVRGAPLGLPGGSLLLHPVSSPVPLFGVSERHKHIYSAKSGISCVRIFSISRLYLSQVFLLFSLTSLYFSPLSSTLKILFCFPHL